MAKITYTDKDKTGIVPINKWRDSDANEVKASVNAIYDKLSYGVFASLDIPAGTTITTAGTYYPIAGTFTNNPTVGFDVVADPAIKFTADDTLYFEIDWHATFEAPHNNCTVSFGISKNGSLIISSRMSAFAKNLDQIYALSGTTVVELSQDDKIQLIITSDTDGDVITVDNYTTTIKPFSLSNPLTSS